MVVLKDWRWKQPTYSFEVSKEVQKVEIDRKQQMADIERENNIWSRK